MRRFILRRGKLFITTLLFLLCSLYTASSQQLKISARLDSSAIQVGDQIKLTIDIDQPEGAKIKLPVFKDTVTGNVEVIKAFPSDSSRKNGMLHITKSFLVTSFDSGFHTIKPIAVPYELGQVKDTLRSQTLYLRVYTLPVDSAKDVRDIKPPLKAPFSILEYWYFILGGLGIILLIAFGIWYYNKRKNKEPLFSARKPSVPPHVAALHELDALRAEKLWQNNKTKQYYTTLTDILRTYIEKRFSIKAMEQTSDEIIQSVKDVYLEDQSVLGLLIAIFSTADLVKFAKGQPLPNENESNLLNAYQFVNNTKLSTPSTMEANENEKINKED